MGDVARVNGVAYNVVVGAGCGRRLREGVNGARWSSRSSKPLRGGGPVVGGFDSHALPPVSCHFRYRMSLGDELLKRISIDPLVCHGKACVKGTRVPVHLLLAMMAAGDSVQDILQIVSFSH